MKRVLSQIEENHTYTNHISEKVGELKSQSGSLDQIVQRFKTKQETVH